MGWAVYFCIEDVATLKKWRAAHRLKRQKQKAEDAADEKARKAEKKLQRDAKQRRKQREREKTHKEREARKSHENLKERNWYGSHKKRSRDDDELVQARPLLPMESDSGHSSQRNHRGHAPQPGNQESDSEEPSTLTSHTLVGEQRASDDTALTNGPLPVEHGSQRSLSGGSRRVPKPSTSRYHPPSNSSSAPAARNYMETDVRRQVHGSPSHEDPEAVSHLVLFPRTT
ncbi:hypothetical protein T439DRAFT_382100 [Meredithblackwellia eburnea MCA 4105]